MMICGVRPLSAAMEVLKGVSKKRSVSTITIRRGAARKKPKISRAAPPHTSSQTVVESVNILVEIKNTDIAL
jgi:hypothetical protein